MIAIKTIMNILRTYFTSVSFVLSTKRTLVERAIIASPSLCRRRQRVFSVVVREKRNLSAGRYRVSARSSRTPRPSLRRSKVRNVAVSA